MLPRILKGRTVYIGGQSSRGTKTMGVLRVKCPGKYANLVCQRNRSKWVIKPKGEEKDMESKGDGAGELKASRRK